MSTSVIATSAALSLPRMASNRKVGALTVVLACLHCDTSPLVPDALQTRAPADVAGATTCSSPQYERCPPIRYQKDMYPTCPNAAHATPR